MSEDIVQHHFEVVVNVDFETNEVTGPWLNDENSATWWDGTAYSDERGWFNPWSADTAHIPEDGIASAEVQKAFNILARLKAWHAENAQEPDPFYPTTEVMYEGSGADHAEFFYTLLEESLK